jgi:hypothetical protein
LISPQGGYHLVTGQPLSDHPESEFASDHEQPGAGRFRVSGP